MLSLEHATKIYKVGTFGSGELPAVRQVSFQIEPHEVVSLIGESGSGKSTVGRMILRLIKTTSGRITLDGADVALLRGSGLKRYYGEVQGVFQDPFSSYNPIFKVDRIFSMIQEEYFTHASSAEWRSKVDDALASVGLIAEDVLGKYPHQLSGGSSSA